MTTEETAKPKQRPVHVERVGWVQASVWQRTGRRGEFHEVSLRRGYTAQDGTTKYSGAFNLRDLADLKLVLERTAEAIKARVTDPVASNGGSSSGGPLEGPHPDENNDLTLQHT